VYCPLKCNTRIAEYTCIAEYVFRVLPSQIAIRETGVAAIRARTLQYAKRVLCNVYSQYARVLHSLLAFRIAEYGLPIINKL
jgi:hypothetical protein